MSQIRRDTNELQHHPLDVSRPHLVLGWWLLWLPGAEQREERIPEPFVAEPPHRSRQHSLAHHLFHLSRAIERTHRWVTRATPGDGTFNQRHETD